MKLNLMELISKISKGTNMDQIYIPKNRIGFPIGNYVLITSVSDNVKKISKKITKPFLYNIKIIEPIKIRLINEVFSIIDKKLKDYDNIIITGSFLEKGFCFNDLDILLLTSQKINSSLIEESIENEIGIKTHLIIIDNKSLIKGLSTDPLYQLMLSRFISKKRTVYKIKKEINYKLLDLHLLKSKIVIDNFDILTGDEKYYNLRNIISIYLFLKEKKLSIDVANNHIKELFHLKDINEIKQNLLPKKDFLEISKRLYNETFNLIMKNIK